MRVSTRSTSTRLPRHLAFAAGLAVSLAVSAQDQPTPDKPPPAPDSPLVAQDPPDPYEDRPIREVRLLRINPDNPGAPPGPLTGPNAQLARNQLRTLEGRPFRRKTVTLDITALNSLGRFKTIASQVQLQSDGSVIVFYTVTEQAIVQDVQIVGNREITDQEAMAIAGALADTPVDRFEIDRAARGIENLYRERGFYAARVEVDEKELADSSILVYRVIEGERIRVMGVEFPGAAAFTPKELRSAIRTTEYVPIFEKGPLDKEVLLDDVAALGKFYKDRGYLDARVAHQILESPNGREAIVRFQVEEGPLYTLRSVQLRYTTPGARAEYQAKFPSETGQVAHLTPEQMVQIGRRAYSNAQITGLMVLKPGDVFSMDKLRRSKDAIKAAYGKFGNVVEDALLGPGPVRITEREVRDERTPEVDLILFIDEGKPAKVGNIIIMGNEKTKQQVILYHIQAKPDRPLDTVAVAESRKRLEDTRLFDPQSVKVSIQPERPGDSEYRDLLFEVTETNTGSFNFGVAVDSDAGLVGQVSLTQRNFDLFDPPQSLSELLTFTGFRGGGQTASLQIQPGTETQTYSISLAEPHFLDSDFSAASRAFYLTRDYDTYDEERYGIKSGIGRRFGTVWDGSVGVRTEWVDVSDVESDSPVDLFEVAELKFITGLGVEMARDTTNDRTRPSRGSRLGLGVEQVGIFGGDFDFTRINASYRVFLNIYESFLGYKTILKLEGIAGWIPQGQDSVPLYERFYLGGQTFRGFENRGVSPVGIRNDTGQPGEDTVGGAFMCFFGAELNQPFYQDILSGVIFVDSGTVQTEPGLDQYRVSVGVGARVYIKQVSPLPLAFDFGFPIVKEDTDHTETFTFAIDVPF